MVSFSSCTDFYTRQSCQSWWLSGSYRCSSALGFYSQCSGSCNPSSNSLKTAHNPSIAARKLKKQNHISENIQSSLVELLMTVPSIGLNIQDAHGMTPLDILKQRPRSTSFDIVIKQLISAGGISSCEDHRARSALVSQLKMSGVGNKTPGTCFRVLDAEILLCIDQSSNKKASSVNYGAGRLKLLLQWPSREKKNAAGSIEFRDDDDSLESSFSMFRNMEDSLIPLRQKYSQLSSFPTNHTSD